MNVDLTRTDKREMKFSMELTFTKYLPNEEYNLPSIDNLTVYYLANYIIINHKISGNMKLGNICFYNIYMFMVFVIILVKIKYINLTSRET